MMVSSAPPAARHEFEALLVALDRGDFLERHGLGAVFAVELAYLLEALLVGDEDVELDDLIDVVPAQLLRDLQLQFQLLPSHFLAELHLGQIGVGRRVQKGRIDLMRQVDDGQTEGLLVLGETLEYQVEANARVELALL